MIVVTGATGNVGRPLVDLLLSEGESVRALTRAPERAGLPQAAETVRADFTDGATRFEPLLAGADALYLNIAGTGSEAAAALVEAAAKAGVRRVVFLSSAGVTDTPADDDNAISHMHAVVERAIRDSGLRWTFVRPGMFAANTLAWAEQIRRGGVVRGPFADAVAVPVHEADIAAVSAAALTDRTGAHDGVVHHVTGPAGLTSVEMVRTIGEAIGRELRFEELTREEALRWMTEVQGVPRPIAEAVLSWTGREEAARVTPDVERVTGRPARTYAQWVADHVEAFAFTDRVG